MLLFLGSTSVVRRTGGHCGCAIRVSDGEVLYGVPVRGLVPPGTLVVADPAGGPNRVMTDAAEVAGQLGAAAVDVFQRWARPWFARRHGFPYGRGARGTFWSSPGLFPGGVVGWYADDYAPDIRGGSRHGPPRRPSVAATDVDVGDARGAALTTVAHTTFGLYLEHSTRDGYAYVTGDNSLRVSWMGWGEPPRALPVGSLVAVFAAPSAYGNPERYCHDGAFRRMWAVRIGSVLRVGGPTVTVPAPAPLTGW